MPMRLLPTIAAALMLCACGGATPAESESAVPNAKTKSPASAEEPAAHASRDTDERAAKPELAGMAMEKGAIVTFRDETYELVMKTCGVSSSGDGNFNVWAITPDEEGTPSDGPRLHVHGATGSSTMRFFTGAGIADVESTFTGDAAFAFVDRTLTYDGPAAEGASETIQFKIQC